MLTYTGGNPLRDEARYAFGFNFLSDLGVKLPYSHTPQPLTNLFWAMALGSAAIALTSYVQSLKGTQGSRLSAALACLSLLGVGLLPSDVYFWPHRVALLAFLASLITAFAFLSRTTKEHAPRILLITCLFYLLFLLLGPRPETSLDARTVHVLAQKLMVGMVFATLIATSARKLRS
ncbi:MAG: hypothetical protein ACAH35_05440 [Candidatus Paceibacterota bacterium]